MLEWGLHAYRGKAQSEDQTHRFTLVRRASEVEVEAARAAIADISAHMHRESFALVTENYEAFNAAEDDVLAMIESSPQTDWPPPSEIARRLRFHFFNWLMSARAFVDSTKTQLSRRYGSDSAQVRRFIEATADQYDSVFAYRFLWKLRNYAQHWDWPQLDGGIRVDVDHEPPRWLELYFDRNLLLAYDGWGPVRGELETLPDEIHLEDLVDQMMGAVRRIAAEVHKIDEAGLRDSLSALDGYWREVEDGDARPCFVLNDLEASQDGMQVLWIPYKSTSKLSGTTPIA